MMLVYDRVKETNIWSRQSEDGFWILQKLWRHIVGLYRLTLLTEYRRTQKNHTQNQAIHILHWSTRTIIFTNLRCHLYFQGDDEGSGPTIPDNLRYEKSMSTREKNDFYFSSAASKHVPVLKWAGETAFHLQGNEFRNKEKIETVNCSDRRLQRNRVGERKSLADAG